MGRYWPCSKQDAAQFCDVEMRRCLNHTPVMEPAVSALSASQKVILWGASYLNPREGLVSATNGPHCILERLKLIDVAFVCGAEPSEFIF